MKIRISSTSRRGIALVPAILIVAGLAVFTMLLMTAVVSGKKTTVHQSEDYQVTSTVESVALLAAEGLWSNYIDSQGGAAGDIASFRTFLTNTGIANDQGTGMPAADEGLELTGFLDLPLDGTQATFNDANVDAVRLVRRDVGDATQLYLTVSASTKRGEGLVNPVLNRAVQSVYTVEPAEFPGFEYALLANNVNCVFCHTRIDSAERWWNTDLAALGSFERVKVGTLESLVLRHDADGSTEVNDNDADSFIAGSLYVRGLPLESSGDLITSWAEQSLKTHPFDLEGHILETSLGLELGDFSPAGDSPLGNLYLDYALDYAQQVDGYLPESFPSPFADDGGVDPSTGEFDETAAGNKHVDDSEFHEVAATTAGSILAGIVNVVPPGESIDSVHEYQTAVSVGNSAGLATSGNGVDGSVVLTGWPDNPIWINGTMAIDGDLVIQGYVKGEGSLYVRGNIYVPADLMYADGKSYLPGDTPGNPTGPRTFGIAADGTKNALALTAGGSIVMGDFQRPAAKQPDGSVVEPTTFETISGDPSGKWNFPLSEMAIFNRGEWAKTQPTLPGADGLPVTNPGYIAGYVPRYYSYGEGSIVPIYNKGPQYFDPHTSTWHGPETPISWNEFLLTYANPANPSDPLLYGADGRPKAVTSAIDHTGGWMADGVYKSAVEYFEAQRPRNTPMKIDGLLYTNNAIFGIVYRNSTFGGMLLMNGSLIAADVGLLVPGKKDRRGVFPNHSPLSEWAIGLQLNYDKRLKKALDIENPFQVQLKRTYWNPTANVL